MPCEAGEQRILPLMDDPAWRPAQEVHALLIRDPGVSELKKTELGERSDFENMAQIANRTGELSPFVRDLICGGRVPRPCKWSRGREKEIGQQHELLMTEENVFLYCIQGIEKAMAGWNSPTTGQREA